MDKLKAQLQLGMNAQTALHRLYRLVLFMTVQKAGLDACFRCGGKITRVEDLSIDHKKPWLDVDPNLFWDLENIAFSHYSCNSLATRGSKGKKWSAEQKERQSKAQKKRFEENPLTEKQKAQLLSTQHLATAARLRLYAAKKAAK